MTNTTLKQISEVLGLSISTISRALKDHPDISEKTKKRVIELANTLDYEPNVNAINLRTSKSKLFGLIIPSISHLFYNSFVSAVEEESRKSGYSLMILQSGNNPDNEIINLKLFRQNRIAGLFVCLSSSTTNIQPFLKLEEQEVPVIFFDKVPEMENCNKVCVADTQSAVLAANAILLKKKKKVLGIFGSPDLLITKKRLAAFISTFKEKQGNNVQLIIDYATSVGEAESITCKRFKDKIDVAFCMSDEILLGAMKAVQKNGLKIPRDIGIIAISDGFIPTLFMPEITYVETSGYKLGKLAFSSMLACIAGSSFQQELISASVLVNGGSL